MKNPAVAILVKVFGTAVLALGFVALVGKVPFMPQTGSSASADAPGAVAGSDRPVPRLAAGEMSVASPYVAPDAPVPVTGDMAAAMGLFKAQFAATGTSSGFATEEHRVPGQCQGAGRRYLDQVCPGCPIVADRDAALSQSMLMWTDLSNQKNVVHAVSTDCVSLAADGVPIVGALTMSSGTADLTDGSSDFARDIVPLLPGATRVAAVEIGDWLAVFDHVARPSTALPDMAAALTRRGWRETAGDSGAGPPAFAGDRVFTKNVDVFCVVSLSEQGGNYQLLTVVSSGARG